MSLEEPTPRETAIISALAGDIIDDVKKALEDITPFIHDKIQFLIDAEIIDPEHADSFLRGALHLALDCSIDEQADEDAGDEDEKEEIDLPDLTPEQLDAVRDSLLKAIKSQKESEEEFRVY